MSESHGGRSGRGGVGRADAVHPRIRPLDTPGLQLTDALWRVLTGLSAGSVSIFLLVVVLGLIVEELGLASVMGIDVDLDALFRASMGPVLISWGVMLLAWPPLIIARRSALMSAAEQLARQHPDDVPPRESREALRTTPAETMREAGVWVTVAFGILLVILIAMTIYMTGESWESTVITLIITLCAAVPFACGWAAIVFGRRLEPEQRELLGELAARWRTQAPRAEAVERKARETLPAVPVPRMLRPGRRGGVIATVQPWIVGSGLVLFMLGLFLRQPCTECDPRTLGPTGERLIDLFSGVGGALLTLVGVGCGVAWVMAVAMAFVREETLRRWLSRGAADAAGSPVAGIRIDDDAQRAHLLQLPGAASMLAVTLGGFGSMELIIAGGIEMVGWEGLDASVALVIGQAMVFAAALVALLAQRREARLRMLLRDTLLPGDPGAPADSARAESGRRARRNPRR